ncbi:unnamed protein product [Gongylonema pulchrum]|uniref:TMEM132D_N domain-containing protein n=1 Tax=Gongylonema pulchrum TaxID=637853 RepID=A0A183E7V5_9BILA|nr:unnamed protein product [Gongylonema pulchrum]
MSFGPPTTDSYFIYEEENPTPYIVQEAVPTSSINDWNGKESLSQDKHHASCNSCNPENTQSGMSTKSCHNEVTVHPEIGAVISTDSTIIQISYRREVPKPAELYLSGVLKEECDEDGEDLALPSPGTLNDMMSKIQS